MKVVHGLRSGGAAGAGPGRSAAALPADAGGEGRGVPLPVLPLVRPPWLAPLARPPGPQGPVPLQHVSGGTHLTGLTEVSESPATTAK